MRAATARSRARGSLGHRSPAGRRWAKVLALVGAGAVLLSGCTVARGFGVDRDAIPQSALCPGKPRAPHVTVIRYWQVWAVPASLASAQAFNCDHPDIAVDLTPSPQAGDDTNGKLLAATAAKKPPDLVLSFDDVLSAWAARGQLQPLDDLAAENGIEREDYIDQAWRSSLWRGKQYGIPMDWDPDSLLWWNKKVFKAAGLDPDRPPRTWAEVQSYSKKIDKIEKNGTITRLGFVPWSGWQFGYLQLAQQWNAKLDSGADPDSVVVDSPGTRKAFAYMHQVATRYGGSAKVNAFTTATGAQGQVIDPLTSGRVGMTLVGDWQIGQQAVMGEKKFRETVGVTAMPPPPGGRSYLCHSGWSFMIPVGAKHTREAMTFVTWMQKPENFAKFLGQPIGMIGARKDARDQPYLANDPTWQQILKIEREQGFGWWLEPSPILQQYYRVLDQQQSAVIGLQTPPDQAVRTAQELADDAQENARAVGVYGTGS